MVPVTTPPLTNSRAIYRAKLVLSPVGVGSGVGVGVGLGVGVGVGVGSGTVFRSTVKVVVAVPFWETMLRVCSPAARVSRYALFSSTTVLPA